MAGRRRRSRKAAPVHTRHLLRTTLIAGLLKLAGIFLAFVFLLVAARASTDAEYGVFAAAFSLATILGFAFTGGQHLAVLRFWPALDEAQGRGAADAALRWSLRRTALACGLGGGALALICLAAAGLERPAPDIMQAPLALGAMTVAFALSEVAQAALRARGSVVLALSGREIGWRVLAIAGILGLGTLTGATLLWLAAATLAVVSTAQLAGLVWTLAPDRALPPEDRQSMARTSGWLWAGATAGPLGSHCGTVVVALTLGPAAAGAYFAADRIAKLLSIALIAVNQAMAPVLSREFHAGRIEAVGRLMTLGAVMAGGIAICGGLVLAAAGPFALGLFSDSYRAAFPALAFLILGQVVNTLCGPNAMLLNMAGLEKQGTLVLGAWSVAAPALVGLGATTGGLTGAAAAAAVAMAGWNLNVLWICHARLGILPWSTRRLRAG